MRPLSCGAPRCPVYSHTAEKCVLKKGEVAAYCRGWHSHTLCFNDVGKCCLECTRSRTSNLGILPSGTGRLLWEAPDGGCRSTEWSTHASRQVLTTHSVEGSFCTKATYYRRMDDFG